MSLQFTGRGQVIVLMPPYALQLMLLLMQTFVHVITTEPLFRFISILAGFLALTYRLPNKILVNFSCDLDLEFSRSNIEFAVPQHKMVQLPWNEKQQSWLNTRPQMGPTILTLAMTLTLNFLAQIFNLLYRNKKWPNHYKTENKQMDWMLGLKCVHQF